MMTLRTYGDLYRIDCPHCSKVIRDLWDGGEGLRIGSKIECDHCLCLSSIEDYKIEITLCTESKSASVDAPKVPKVQIRRTVLGWQRHVYAVSKSKGWHSGEPDIWKFLGNLMAEAAESWEEARKPDFEPKRTYYREDGKPEGLAAELADVVIRAMDTAESFGIDLEAAIAEKSAFNERRPMRHGGKRA